MIDAPGPWGTGPFALAEGHSVIDAEQAVVRRDPFACTWTWPEVRTPRVRLAANPDYWDAGRGPRVAEVVFKNDLPPDRALDLVCTTEGEVDILTEVPPAEAARVEASAHARLVAVDAVRAVAGVINRDADGLPLADRRARLALNLAVDRARLVTEAFAGYAAPLAGLTPPAAVSAARRLAPYRHDPRRAADLWREAGGGRGRPVRVAAFAPWGRVADRVAADLREALRVDAEVTVHAGRDEHRVRRELAEKGRPPDWDVLILMQACQEAESPPLELHRAFVGATGEYRAGPVVPGFEAAYAELVREPSQVLQLPLVDRLEKLVHDEALALFLAAPHALYAVNKEVTFTPYRTTFELAECEVGRNHWSRRQGG